MRRIRLVADDYAISPGVSAAIRDLLAAGRLSGTSTMAVSPELAVEADLLKTLMPARPFQTGLHVTLTGAFTPLTSDFAPRDGATFPQLARLMTMATLGRLDRRAVAGEVRAQFAAFAEAFGRPPDFVDGHQHVHLLPTVRDAVLAATADRAPGAWVRDCRPARRGAALSPKVAVLAALSAGFADRAARLGLATNPAFAGAYGFTDDADFATLFAGFLDGLPDGGVVMCHPGFVDATLAARDPLTGPREAEHAFLAGPGLSAALAAAGAELA